MENSKERGWLGSSVWMGNSGEQINRYSWNDWNKEQASIKTSENLQSETAGPNKQTKKRPESQYCFYKH